MNKIQVWIKAARPQTLPASTSPVIIACALAYYDGGFEWLAGLLCFMVALSAQISVNFANDYYDFKKGADRMEDRTGPERAVTSGWVTPRQMLYAAIAMTAVTAAFGLFLLFMTSWYLIIAGILILLFIWAYTAGPYPISYKGWGDVCVLVFFGPVPLCLSYFAQVGTVSLTAIILSVVIGLLIVNILVVNNYRDYEQDKASGKMTSVVRMGRKFGLGFYYVNIAIAAIATLFALFPLVERLWMFIPWFVSSVFACLSMKKNEGRALNSTLSHTGLNVLLYALTSVVFFVTA